jgi:hypothetical protein
MTERLREIGKSISLERISPLCMPESDDEQLPTMPVSPRARYLAMYSNGNRKIHTTSTKCQ